MTTAKPRTGGQPSRPTNLSSTSWGRSTPRRGCRWSSGTRSSLSAAWWCRPGRNSTATFPTWSWSLERALITTTIDSFVPLPRRRNLSAAPACGRALSNGVRRRTPDYRHTRSLLRIRWLRRRLRSSLTPRDTSTHLSRDRGERARRDRDVVGQRRWHSRWYVVHGESARSFVIMSEASPRFFYGFRHFQWEVFYTVALSSSINIFTCLIQVYSVEIDRFYTNFDCSVK